MSSFSPSASPAPIPSSELRFVSSFRMFLQHNNDPMEEEPPFSSEEGMGAGEAEGENEDIAEEELTEDEIAEFSVLNRQLDQLDQALDAIEQKNDNIHDK